MMNNQSPARNNLDFIDAILEMKDEANDEAIAIVNDVTVYIIANENHETDDLRFILAKNHPLVDSFLQIAYDVACTIFSETTNDDACDVIVRERSAHFQHHPDLRDAPNDVVVYDVEILDSMS
jgi:hypothetical protein